MIQGHEAAASTKTGYVPPARTVALDPVGTVFQVDFSSGVQFMAINGII